ncbi:MAG TPA: hypothetical protein VGF97_11460 [Rhizomicrobium sp.]|jgi:hypothetical protein
MPLRSIRLSGLLLLVATLFAPGPAPAAETPIKTIGIISAVGDTLEVSDMGLTVFTDAHRSMDVSDWKLGHDIAGAFQDVLSRRYDARVVAEDAPMAEMEKPPSELAAAVRALLKPGETYDAYLLIVPATRPDTMGWTKQNLSGIGLYRRHKMIDSEPFIFTSCNVSLIDGRSLQILQDTWMDLPRDEGLAGVFTAVSKMGDYDFFAGVAEQAWPDPDQPFRPEQKMSVEASFQYLLKREAPFTLHKLGLAD